MDTTNTPPRDNDRLTWHVRTRKYRDAQTCRWTLYAMAEVSNENTACPRMFTRVVGEWDGLARNRQQARKDAAALCRHLKDSRLYIIHITAKAIDDGEERNCSLCAVAQALWTVQKFTWKHDAWYHSFRVDTYGAWRDAKGISYEGLHTESGRAVMAPESLPSVVTNYRRDGKAMHYGESMVEWTMAWDEWAEARHMTPKEYTDAHHEEPPLRPSPAFFILNADDFEVMEPFKGRGTACFIAKDDTDDDE